MKKIFFLLIIFLNFTLADEMSSFLKQGCQIIVKSQAKNWTAKSVSAAYYIHGISDANIRLYNTKGYKINANLFTSYNKIIYETCKKSLQNNSGIDFREKIYIYNLEIISSYYR